MNLYMVYVKDTRDPESGFVNKDIASYRIAQTRVPLTTFQREEIRQGLIGDQLAIWLLVDHPSEIESKLIEAGFVSKIEFIQNYSKVIN